MTWMPDSTLDHLREIAERPDLPGDRYEILEKLGHGGMGTVWRVRDKELERDVALKILATPRLDSGARNRMLREARILARLEHPGIVPVHDVGVLEDGRVWYAMKLVRGSRLDEYARDLDLVGRLQVFVRICEAVAFAHAQGILHRDLKPENVMVGAFGEVLVLDWGVAKILDAGSDSGDVGGRDNQGELDSAGDLGAAQTSTDLESVDLEGETLPDTTPGSKTNPGTVLGTPGYMSPEQAAGRTDFLDERTDVYALGAILRDLVAESPTRPLHSIFLRALSKDPARRYAGAEEMAEDISEFLVGGAVSAHRESIWDRASRIARRHRVAILLILTYLIVRILWFAFAGT